MPQNDYKDLDKYMTYTLIGTGIAFVLYLLFALLGIVWLKVVLSILIFLVCAGVLTVLYLSGEISKRRSRWMTLGAACTAWCLFVSLITGCPYKRTTRGNPRVVFLFATAAAVSAVSTALFLFRAKQIDAISADQRKNAPIKNTHNNTPT